MILADLEESVHHWVRKLGAVENRAHLNMETLFNKEGAIRLRIEIETSPDFYGLSPQALPLIRGEHPV